MTQLSDFSDYPAWICHDCGVAHGKRAPTLATWHEDICGWCGATASVTEPRDFGYPAQPQPSGAFRPMNQLHLDQAVARLQAHIAWLNDETHTLQNPYQKPNNTGVLVDDIAIVLRALNRQLDSMEPVTSHFS